MNAPILLTMAASSTLLACLTTVAATPDSAPHAGHLTATRAHTFVVALPPAGAFTLFEPVGEKLWAEGWNPVFASAKDANLSTDTVFTRDLVTQGQTGSSVWLITRYDRPAGAIEYRVVYPGQRVARITVQCHPAPGAGTNVEVTYRYTGLSAEGDHYIAAMTDEKYRAFIEEWASAIRAWQARGTPATP
jgi:hypothetical protein